MIVAIPARDEAALIGRCLDALMPQGAAVLVLVNNATDATAAIARERGAEVVEVTLDPPGAGFARRMALALAADRDERIATTDADCVPDPDWIAQMEAALDGVDAVAGRVSGDWAELQHQPPEALQIGDLEWRYLALRAAAEARFDPRPHDPAPRHAQRCGANIGITRAALERVGGVPAMASGEDRALLAALDAIDAKVRHAVGPHVTASGRQVGRASGGMADALAARTNAEYRSDEQFEDAETLVHRVRVRADARAAWTAGAWPDFAQEHDLASVTSQPYFGATWAAVEAATPALAHHPLDVAALERAVARLEELLA